MIFSRAGACIATLLVGLIADPKEAAARIYLSRETIDIGGTIGAVIFIVGAGACFYKRKFALGAIVLAPVTLVVVISALCWILGVPVRPWW